LDAIGDGAALILRGGSKCGCHRLQLTHRSVGTDSVITAERQERQAVEERVEGGAVVVGVELLARFVDAVPQIDPARCGRSCCIEAVAQAA
jgi:predicted  nucleic acid-binding Zn-ribbon protein